MVQTISGGSGNQVTGRTSSIGGGDGNQVGGFRSVVAGGVGNCIMSASSYNAIGGGAFNCMVTTAGTYSTYSVIAGGHGNKIYSNYSAVLGGRGNCVLATHNYAGIFGNGINSVSPSTFHVNCLNLNALPRAISAPPIPFGSLWVDTSGGPGNCIVRII